MSLPRQTSTGVVGRIEREIQENIDVNTNLRGPVVDVVAKMAQKIIACLKAKNQLIVFGNGGSAADAQHIAGELVGRFRAERKALRAIALGTNCAAFSATANDSGFEEVFAREISALGSAGDVALAMSTSGNSSNVLKGLARARQIGLYTMGLSGSTGGKMLELLDLCICVPSDATPRIQEAHILIGHILCGLVEEAFVQTPSAVRQRILTSTSRS